MFITESSLVGFSLLIILSPAPGYVGKLIAKYEKEQMSMVCAYSMNIHIRSSLSYRFGIKDRQTCPSSDRLYELFAFYIVAVQLTYNHYPSPQRAENDKAVRLGALYATSSFKSQGR